jgi:hypothetical protein
MPPDRFDGPTFDPPGGLGGWRLLASNRASASCHDGGSVDERLPDRRPRTDRDGNDVYPGNVIEDYAAHVPMRSALRQRAFEALPNADVDMPYETIELAPGSEAHTRG